MSHGGQTLEIEILERRLLIETQPGLPGWRKVEQGRELLIEAMQIEPQDEVVELACGYGLTGIVAALLAEEGQVLLVDDDLLAVECARTNLWRNRILNATARLTADYADLPDASYDVALLHAPAYRGNDLVRHLIATAHRLVRPGGRFFLAGGKREGLNTFQHWAEEWFEPAEVLARGGGHRVLRLKKETAESEPPKIAAAEPVEFEATLRGEKFRFRSRPGVFSHGKVDAASRLLLEEAEIESGRTILDLGCGYGLLGIVAARVAPQAQVVLLDRSLPAVECARENAALNEVQRVEVIAAEGTTTLQDRRFDLILCNPPFHAGRAADRSVGEQLVREGARVLAPGGRFYVVANQFLPYERALVEELGQEKEIARQGGFKVLLSHKEAR